MKRFIMVFATTLVLVVLSACKDDTLAVVVVSTPPLISVDRGSDLDESILPTEVSVLLEDETFAQIEIDWDTDMLLYDLHTESITVEGTLMETEMFKNPLDFTVTQTIRFDPIDVIDTIELFPEYSIFYQALIESDIVSTLDPEIEYTFLLPTNTAFAAFFADLEITLEDFLDSDLLDEIVSTHIVVGNYTDSVLRAASPVTLDVMDETEVEVTLVGNSLKLGDTHIIGEMDATNGNILEIDSVFLPSINIAEDINQGIMIILTANLMAMIQEQDLLDEILSGDGITIFMPTEDALITLLLQYGLSIDDVAANQELLEIIRDHIFGTYYTAEDLYLGAPMTITNSTGIPYDITVVDGNLYIDGIQVISSTVNDQFGVIHEIDGVLLTDEMRTFLEEYNSSN